MKRLDDCLNCYLKSYRAKCLHETCKRQATSSSVTQVWPRPWRFEAQGICSIRTRLFTKGSTESASGLPRPWVSPELQQYDQEVSIPVEKGSIDSAAQGKLVKAGRQETAHTLTPNKLADCAVAQEVQIQLGTGAWI